MDKEKNTMVFNDTMYFYVRHGDFSIAHCHKNFWEFIFVTEGEYRHIVNDNSRNITKYTLCLLRPDDFHSTRAIKPQSCYIIFCITQELLSNLFYFIDSEFESTLQEQPFIEIHVSPAKGKIIEDMVNHWLVSDQTDPKAIRFSLLFSFINEILPLLCTDNSVPGYKKYSPGVTKFINQLKNPSNYAKSLKDLIANTGYSYSHMNGLFKKETGETPATFLKQKRLGYAKKMLLMSDIKHEKIAFQIGFATPSRFSIFFKRETGLTPSEYAKKYRILS